MTEQNLVQVDNETLVREYNFFKSVSEAAQKAHEGATHSPLRQAYITELEKVFHSSNRKHDNKIDRQEFESLIQGYLELKGISPTKEIYDALFEKLDIDHDKVIEMHEFVKFVDQVVENDILPFLAEEMQNRDLL